jgi:flavin reductase (DIM6/NTAB) family NADH-FMN oxidoreductase RutF
MDECDGWMECRIKKMRTQGTHAAACFSTRGVAVGVDDEMKAALLCVFVVEW